MNKYTVAIKYRFKKWKYFKDVFTYDLIHGEVYDIWIIQTKNKVYKISQYEIESIKIKYNHFKFDD